MKSLRILVTLCLIMAFSQVSFSQRAELKGRIDSHFTKFEGKVTHHSIGELIAGLKSLSSKEANMCFVSIADYNDCMDRAATVYQNLYTYLDDLMGKDITVTQVKALKPWEDEDYYTLQYKLSYVNANPDYPTDVNWDTIDLGIQDNCIKDVIHSREWFGLSEYVKN
ncbi:MAG: hypothetical protein HUJ25_11025 [Crocinitomicaceae bacterium]|nr:hypothetical protein [Crocinitomicaceae bacterium]